MQVLLCKEQEIEGREFSLHTATSKEQKEFPALPQESMFLSPTLY